MQRLATRQNGAAGRRPVHVVAAVTNAGVSFQFGASSTGAEQIVACIWGPDAEDEVLLSCVAYDAWGIASPARQGYPGWLRTAATLAT